MKGTMTGEFSRAIRSSTLYHVFLISWIQCIIVIMCSVTMTTQSSDGYTATGICNTSADHERQDVRTLELFLTILPVPCPPHNSLQLVCDHSVGAIGQTCNDRALIIDKCLNQYPGLYTNSLWTECLDVNKCVTVFKNVLYDNGFINETVYDGSSVSTTTVTASTTTVIAPTTKSSTTASSSVTFKPVRSSITTSTLSTGQACTSSGNCTTPLNTTSTPSNTSTDSVSKMDDAITTSGDPAPISYIYPIFGAFIIACEVVALCIFSCYKKKRQRQNTADSLVQQEEMIEPETVSPTKATLTANSVYDEDKVFTEDKNIYKSYINLKYIDDTSVESTPEKALLRT